MLVNLQQVSVGSQYEHRDWRRHNVEEGDWIPLHMNIPTLTYHAWELEKWILGDQE